MDQALLHVVQMFMSNGVGRRSKLNLETRMVIRRRVKEWKGPRNVIYRLLASEHKVAYITIQRCVLG